MNLPEHSAGTSITCHVQRLKENARSGHCQPFDIYFQKQTSWLWFITSGCSCAADVGQHLPLAAAASSTASLPLGAFCAQSWPCWGPSLPISPEMHCYIQISKKKKCITDSLSDIVRKRNICLPLSKHKSSCSSNSLLPKISAHSQEVLLFSLVVATFLGSVPNLNFEIHCAVWRNTHKASLHRYSTIFTSVILIMPYLR